jgi:Asp-tRNA(Asn)/Glu-tRNA(Gln) amidotransferase A subunit family amidase
MAADKRLLELPAPIMRDRLASGAMRSTEIAEAVIARVEAQNAGAGVLAWFDAGFVRRQAEALDLFRGRGLALGPLHGVPVVIEDTIDVARIPTENGTPADKGRVPERDSAISERLRAAGALLVGKAAAPELGVSAAEAGHGTAADGAPGALAIAEGMAPLAVATQIAGFVISGASDAGVTGFKPSFGSISRRGTLRCVPSLETPGIFAADVAGAAMLADVLAGYDAADPSTSMSPPPRLLDHARSQPPLTPTLAFVRTAWWDEIDAETQAAFSELTDRLASRCFAADLPPVFADSALFCDRIVLAELAKCLSGYRARGADLLSHDLRAALERGDAVTAREYLVALDWREVLYAGIEAVLERCDAIITPASTAADTQGASAGFNRLWSLLGVPCMSLPLMTGADGRPIGVQMVGRRGDDGRLLRCAHWLETFVSENGEKL